MISFEIGGSTKRLEAFLEKVSKLNVAKIMNSCARDGVNALAAATPESSGLASRSWGYEVSASGGFYQISWTNSDIENGFPVVIMLQFGHGTGTGGYVAGQDFINPAIRPVFDKIADTVWKAVTSA